MLDSLYYYMIFATSGALVSWWSIFRPALYLLCEEECDHPVLRSKFLASVVWLGIAVIVIPVLVVPLLHTNSRVAFIFNLTHGFLRGSEEHI